MNELITNHRVVHIVSEVVVLVGITVFLNNKNKVLSEKINRIEEYLMNLDNRNNAFNKRLEKVESYLVNSQGVKKENNKELTEILEILREHNTAGNIAGNKKKPQESSANNTSMPTVPSLFPTTLFFTSPLTTTSSMVKVETLSNNGDDNLDDEIKNEILDMEESEEAQNGEEDLKR